MHFVYYLTDITDFIYLIGVILL